MRRFTTGYIKVHGVQIQNCKEKNVLGSIGHTPYIATGPQINVSKRKFATERWKVENQILCTFSIRCQQVQDVVSHNFPRNPVPAFFRAKLGKILRRLRVLHNLEKFLNIMKIPRKILVRPKKGLHLILGKKISIFEKKHLFSNYAEKKMPYYWRHFFLSLNLSNVHIAADRCYQEGS